MLRFYLLCLFCLSLSACLSPEGARSLGLEQGLAGEPYQRIFGENSDAHRTAWLEGNAQYCQTLSFPALARALQPLPVGICPIPESGRRAYCRNMDYAALGRADGALPTACAPTSAQTLAFTQARSATYCTRAQGQMDMRRPLKRAWSTGACAPGASRSACEWTRAASVGARYYCTQDPDYSSGMSHALLQAQSHAIGEAGEELADLSQLPEPNEEQSARREALQDYLDWAPTCTWLGERLDC